MLVGEKNTQFWNSSAPAVYFHLRPETYFFPPVVKFLTGEGEGRPLTCNYQKLLPFAEKSLDLSQILTESSPPEKKTCGGC